MKKIIQRKKEYSRKKGKKAGNRQGSITVLVTLLMVPVVAVNGLMVDMARLKMYSSQAAMAADAYGNAVLSQFDHLLKQLYGLFSVTQNEEGQKAIEQLAKYADYSFDPNGDERGLTGFMPYKDLDMELVYEEIDGASLSNNNVLMTQISDFMRFRIVEEIMDDDQILTALEQFDSLDSDMEAMEERSKITDSSAKALGKIDEYYRVLKKLAAYPDYLAGRDSAFREYSGLLSEIVKRQEYEDYVYYLEHQEEIKAVIAEFENSESGDGEEYDDDNLAEKTELYERFADFDPEEYVRELEREIEPYRNYSNAHNSDPIDFYNAAQIIDALGQKADQLEETLTTLDEQVEQLERNLSGCSDSVRAGIEEEIAGLKDILAIADDFKGTYELIAVIHDDKTCNAGNREHMEEEVPVLDHWTEEILQGKAVPGQSPWPQRLSLLWYDFRDQKLAFFQQLEKLCGSGEESGGDKKAGEREIHRANKAQKEAEDQLKGDEATQARDISPVLAMQLYTGCGSSGKVPELTDYFSGGLSFDSLSNAVSNVLDKFLVTSYDFGMFSSRVSGIGIEEDKSDYSLTKIKMSPDVNYLYGAELEYLFGGYNSSVSNLNETRNIICGVRMTMNFASTYRIREINDAIKAIANGAAAAVSATGVGAAAAPLVRVAVSGALRMAVASIEMAADWSSLKKREDVVLFKTELGDLESGNALAGLLNIEMKESHASDKLELSYEDYLYVLLVLLVDDNTLLSRTSNLIMLNVNQAMSDGGALADLKFKMSRTVTAVKSTCKVRPDFVVVPDSIAELFYSNTGTDSTIEMLEDHYFGYSVIRGY